MTTALRFRIPVTSNAEKNAVAVVVLPNGAGGSSRLVKLVWLIALKRYYLPLHRTLTTQLAALMQQPDVIEQLVHQTDFTDSLTFYARHWKEQSKHGFTTDGCAK